MTSRSKLNKPLSGKRILVCGKGGCGKSTFVTLLAAFLQKNSHKVIVLDGDASNPEGLVRLIFGLGVEGEPHPLVEFFGGIDTVTCPVDDPSVLTRVDDPVPVPKKPVDIGKEIDPKFYLQKGGITLFQAGKIDTYGQGCDGPLEKIVRDFVVEGDAVSLIDMKAGIEHFGRRIPDNMDIVLGILDYTLESVSIAKKIAAFCQEAGINHFYLILNKIGSKEIKSILMDKLSNLQERVIGSIPFDEELIQAGLSGQALDECRVSEDIGHIVEKLVAKIGRKPT